LFWGNACHIGLNHIQNDTQNRVMPNECEASRPDQWEAFQLSSLGEKTTHPTYNFFGGYTR
jgi:hypothetical protein